VLPCASVSKPVFVQNFSHENDLDLNENEQISRTHFQMSGF